MIIVILITVIILTAVISYVHCHLKSPFKKQQNLPYLTEYNVTWKELLAYGTCVHLDSKLQGVKSIKIRQLFLLDWEISPVMVKRIPLTNHIVVVVHNSLYPQNSLIQPVSHA